MSSCKESRRLSVLFPIPHEPLCFLQSEPQQLVSAVSRSRPWRAAFTSRNMQIDGVGQANDWRIVTGVFDSFGDEKIEYETKRIEADCSTPFTESGSWAGRAVVAAEEVIRP